MQFIDLSKQQSIIKAQLDEAIQKVMSHGKYILGPEVFELENILSAYVNTKYCITVASGTDAILIALMALGVRAGDEVITSPFTFAANAEMIAMLGATPVFADIDSKTCNISPKEVAKKITKKTKCILAVNLFGQCADYESINDLASNYSIPVIEDAAQSFGSSRFAKKSCNLSDVACTSFFPSKPLGCYGDGGAIFTNDEEIANVAKEIRVHGQSSRYCHSRVGINSRLDTIQAAILLEKIKLFDDEIKKRNAIGENYSRLINKMIPEISTTETLLGNFHIYSQYCIFTKNREEVINRLALKNIPTAVHYPIPLHHQKAFKQNCDDLKNSESISKEIMSLPMHPYLSYDDQIYIVENLLTSMVS